MLQLCPFFEMWEAGTQVSGFEPGIAPALAAVRPHLAGRTFVLVAWLRLIDSLLEKLPALFHRAGAEIITREWESRAQIHFAIGCNGKSALTAGTFDKGLVAWTGFLGWGR